MSCVTCATDDLDSLLHTYNNDLTTALDKHVPVSQKKIIIKPNTQWYIYFIYLGFYITFNTVQVISRRVVGRAEETSTYSLSGFCTVNC